MALTVANIGQEKLQLKKSKKATLANSGQTWNAAKSG